MPTALDEVEVALVSLVIGVVGPILFQGVAVAGVVVFDLTFFILFELIFQL